MKTIIQGNRDAVKEYKYFTCSRCGWSGKAEKGEYQSATQYNETSYWVRCPCCNYYCANEITEAAVLARIKQEEAKLDKADYWQSR